MLNAGPNVTFHKLHLSMLRQLELIPTEIDHYMTHAFSKYFEGFYTKSEYKKIRTRNNSVFGHFSRSDGGRIFHVAATLSIFSTTPSSLT